MNNKVILGDWLDNDIEDKSIDVIMADPPYFEVKGEFDFIWKDFEEYLIDVEKWAVECKRVLKDNGSLFWWGMDRKISYAQIILDKYFDLKNVLKWNKRSAANQWDSRRNFPEITAEHCLFYTLGDDRTGLDVAMNTPELWESIKHYFMEEYKNSGLSIKKANEIMGYATTGSAVAGGLFGNKKEFVFPVEESWLKLQSTGYFKKPYKELLKEYDALREKHRPFIDKIESERRIFNNIHSLKDLIEMPREVNKYFHHPTKKSLRIQKMLIETVTNKNSKILIPFGGSGTDVEACIDLGLNYTCYEIDEKHYKTIKSREKECLKQPRLF